MRAALVCFIALYVVSVLAKYPTFPLYMQCDPAWGQDEMGVPGMGAQDDTICHQGCAMTSLSMALAGYNITINGTFTI